MGWCCSSRRCVALLRQTRRRRSQRSPQSKPNPWWWCGVEACRGNTTQIGRPQLKKKFTWSAHLVAAGSTRRCAHAAGRKEKKSVDSLPNKKNNEHRSVQCDKSVVNEPSSCVVSGFVKRPQPRAPPPAAERTNQRAVREARALYVSLYVYVWTG